MREAPQELVASIFEYDRFGDHGAEPGHALAEPFRHAAAVQRQIGAPCATGHQKLPAEPAEPGFRFFVVKIIGVRFAPNIGRNGRATNRPSGFSRAEGTAAAAR